MGSHGKMLTLQEMFRDDSVDVVFVKCGSFSHHSVGQKPFPILGDIDLLTGRIDSSYVGEKAEKPNQLSLAAKPCIRSQHGIEQAESDEMLETKARRGDGEYGRLDEEAGWYESCGFYGHSLP